ncbi:MAG TPA: MurT ligase domain-containing protein [Patescibacteria group bacterium]|nr:MurT ligase domain-containing protein [Patescibacteria group bacterium]
MDLKLFLAILAGKTLAFVIRLFGGGATAAPGLFALKIDPNLVRKLNRKIKLGSVIISGTNGKTTTARLTYDTLFTKYKVIHNRQGSNLLRGIASTLISNSSIFGKIRFDLAIWEVDEATLPEAIKNVYPQTIVLLNLFRDQLDRYGEIDSTRTKWQKALRTLPKSTILILNSDDPGISILEKSFAGKIVFFGVSDNKVRLPAVATVADVKHCLFCGAGLVFDAQLSAHLGHYRCSKCNFKRPTPDISAANLMFKSDFSTSISLGLDSQTSTISYSLPGLYNVYNVLAASTTALNYGIDLATVIEKIKKFSTAFGRFQKTEIKGRQLITFLIKNPAGANEVLRTISNQSRVNLLLILNDKIADGRDVSWIWDTDWEILRDKTDNVFISGIRRFDMALRLKYAGFKLSNNSIYKEVNYSILIALQKMSTKDTLIVLPTYTALLDVQKTLNRTGEKVSKWQKQ